MSSRKLSTSNTIKGRASLCGNLPSIKLPIVFTEFREIPEYPKYSPPHSPKVEKIPEPKPVISKRYVISENSMERFQEFINDLKKYCVELNENNLSPIIHDLDLVNNTENLEVLFRPFYQEACKYIQALRQSEIDHTYVGSGALRSTSYPFVEHWKFFVQNINKLRDKGMQSMAKYLDLKFQLIDGIVSDIAQHQKRDSVHTKEVEKAASSLRELITQIADGVQYLILKTDIKKMAIDVRDAKIRDMKALLRLYESAHNTEFIKSGYSMSELHHLRANVQSSILDIIGGLKAAFSFHFDLDKIYETIFEVQKLLNRITEQINLPQPVIRTIQQKTITDRRLKKKWKDDPLKDLKQFTKDAPDESSYELIGKIELFIDKISGELGIYPLDTCINLWERLDTLQEVILRRLRSVKETEREFGFFQDKIKNQSGQITTLIKQTHRQEAASEENERRLNKTIADLEDRNTEMMKQRNEALSITRRREEQLFKLRMKLNDNGAWIALQEAAETLSKFLNVPIPDGKNLPKSVTELSSILKKKGCLKCHQHDTMCKEIRNRVGKIITLKPNDSILAIVSNFIAYYQKLRYQYEVADGNSLKVGDDLEALKKCLREIEQKCNEVIQVNTDEENNRPIADIISSTSNSFGFFVEMHFQEIESMKNEFTQTRQEELSTIMKEILRIFPSDKIERNDNIVEMILSILHNANNQYTELKTQYQEASDIIDRVNAWLKLKTNTNGKTIDNMISILDSTENPLEKVVYEQRIASSQLNNELNVIAMKIKGILKITEDTDYMDMQKLMKYSEGLIERLHDKIEKDANTYELKTKEDQMIQDNLASIVIRLRSLLKHEEDVEFSKQTNRSLMTMMNELIDELTGEDLYIDITTVNQLTHRIREVLNLPYSIDPKEYIPMLCEKTEMMKNLTELIKKLLQPLLVIFQKFDFSLGSYNPLSESFSIMKENLLNMHNILKDEMKGEIDPECSTFLSKIVTLVSAFFGFISMALTESKDEQEKLPSLKISSKKSSRTPSRIGSSRKHSSRLTPSARSNQIVTPNASRV